MATFYADTSAFAFGILDSKLLSPGFGQLAYQWGLSLDKLFLCRLSNIISQLNNRGAMVHPMAQPAVCPASADHSK